MKHSKRQHIFCVAVAHNAIVFLICLCWDINKFGSIYLFVERRETQYIYSQAAPTINNYLYAPPETAQIELSSRMNLKLVQLNTCSTIVAAIAYANCTHAKQRRTLNRTVFWCKLSLTSWFNSWTTHECKRRSSTCDENERIEQNGGMGAAEKSWCNEKLTFMCPHLYLFAFMQHRNEAIKVITRSFYPAFDR